MKQIKYEDAEMKPQTNVIFTLSTSKNFFF
jgi:hypothetical protein